MIAPIPSVQRCRISHTIGWELVGAPEQCVRELNILRALRWLIRRHDING